MLLVFGFALACTSSDETEKANVLVDEANKLVTDAQAKVDEGTKQRKDMLQAVNDIKRETEKEDLAKARKMAQELISTYETISQKLTDASKKWEDISKMKLNEKFKEYAVVKVEQLKKTC